MPNQERQTMMIKGVLFDFDGVLTPIDAEIKRELKQAILNKIIESKAVTQDQAKCYFEKALNESEYDEDYFKLQDAALKTGSYDKNEINTLFHAFSRKRLPKIRGSIAKMLSQLHDQDLILGVVTLSSDERIERSLKETGIRKYFSFVESAACEFQKAFPMEWKKAAYQDFLDKYRFRSGEVLCIGDSFSIDLQPAKKLGMQTALITHHPQAKKQRQNSSVNYTLSRSMLPEVLLSISKNT
jgi:FMN phosphatase YigB (HAD superfamily)